jgi:hypothetical protein
MIAGTMDGIRLCPPVIRSHACLTMFIGIASLVSGLFYCCLPVCPFVMLRLHIGRSTITRLLAVVHARLPAPRVVVPAEVHEDSA